MNTYLYKGQAIDSVVLKCLVVSRGVTVDSDVYRKYSKTHRLSVNPLMCNCFFLSDNTIVQLSDVSFHLQHLSGMLSWETLKLLKYASALASPFRIKLHAEKAALFCDETLVDYITFPNKTDFYMQKTALGLPFLGNAVLQGTDWVAFQCLWPCEYAAAGKGCEFCFSGADFEHLSKKKQPLPKPVPPEDMAEMVAYAIQHCGCNSVQITGGSTFDERKESNYIKAYLTALRRRIGKLPGELLLYITPPSDFTILDEYFALGATRIACSIELWDEALAKRITPGKIDITTRKRHLDALTYIAKTYGKGKAFSNFIIGIEPFDSFAQGAAYLAQRGIIPSASVWMPMGRPVNNSMQAPDAAYYRKVTELLSSLYTEHALAPAGGCGLNVCIERDIHHLCTADFAPVCNGTT